MLFRPVVAESVTVFTVPVVRPTPLLRVPVAALEALPMTPGFFAGWAAGAIFFAATGVGFVPSGLAAGLTGVFLMGVALAPVVVVEGVLVAGFAGVLVFAALVAFEDGVAFEMGRGFFVPMGVRAGLGVSPTEAFGAVVGVFFAGLAVDAVFEPADGSDFFVPIGVRAGVAFAGVVVFEAGLFAGIEVDAEFSFDGAFLAGVVVFVVDFAVVAGVAFFTGVAFRVAGAAVFCAVAAGFFAVDWPLCEAPWATLEIFATPAVEND